MNLLMQSLLALSILCGNNSQAMFMASKNTTFPKKHLAKMPVCPLSRNFLKTQTMVTSLTPQCINIAEDFVNSFHNLSLSGMRKNFLCLSQENAYQAFRLLTKNQKILLKTSLNPDIAIATLSQFFDGNEKAALHYYNIPFCVVKERYAHAQKMKLKYPMLDLPAGYYASLSDQQFFLLSDKINNGFILSAEVKDFINGLKTLSNATTKISNIGQTIVIDDSSVINALRIYPRLKKRIKIFINNSPLPAIPAPAAVCYTLSLILPLVTGSIFKLMGYPVNWVVMIELMAQTKEILSLALGFQMFGLAVNYYAYQEHMTDVVLPNTPTILQEIIKKTLKKAVNLYNKTQRNDKYKKLAVSAIEKVILASPNNTKFINKTLKDLNYVNEKQNDLKKKMDEIRSDLRTKLTLNNPTPLGKQQAQTLIGALQIQYHANHELHEAFNEILKEKVFADLLQ